MADFAYIPVDHDPFTDPGVPNYLSDTIAYMGTKPPSVTPQQAKETLWGMTGIPDVQAGIQAMQRGEYLPGFGQAAWGGLQAATLAAPGYAKAAQAAGPRITQPVTNILSDIAGTFLGVGSKTADMRQLRNATQMEQAGADQEAIRQATGWFRGADQQWRYELSDEPSRLNMQEYFARSLPFQTRSEPVLGDILNHPELYKNYPQLKNIPIKEIPPYIDANAAYIPGQNPEIYINPYSDRLRSELLHETQHGIQDIEGFASGGNPRQFLPEDYNQRAQSTLDLGESIKYRLIQDLRVSPQQAEALLEFATTSGGSERLSSRLPDETKSYIDQYVRAAQRLANESNEAYGSYKKLAGETEARLVQERRYLTPNEIQGFSPFAPQSQHSAQYAYEYPIEEQIVRFRTGQNQNYDLVPVDYIPEFK